MHKSSWRDSKHGLEVFTDGDHVDVTLPSSVSLPHYVARDFGLAVLAATDAAEHNHFGHTPPAEDPEDERMADLFAVRED